MTDGSAAGSPNVEAERRWLVEHLEALGATPEEIDDAFENGSLPALIRDYELWGQVPDTSLNDIAQKLGVTPEKVRRVARAAGFTYGLDDKVWVAEDAAMFTSFVEGSALFAPAQLLSYSRMLGDATSRIAEASMSLFMRTMDSEPEPGSPEDLELQERAMSAIGVFRDSVTKTIERMVLHHFVLAGERMSAMRDGQHTVEAAVGFVDLTDSTGLVIDFGARVVEPALAAFEMTAGDAAASRGGRLVKLIGDAAMFIVPEAEQAVAAAREIVEAVGGDDRLRGARGGVTYGELLHRDGDYFGDPVNLAARIANAAHTGTVLVDGAVAKRIGDDAVSDGTRRLEGFIDPVEVFLVR